MMTNVKYYSHWLFGKRDEVPGSAEAPRASPGLEEPKARLDVAAGVEQEDISFPSSPGCSRALWSVLIPRCARIRNPEPEGRHRSGDTWGQCSGLRSAPKTLVLSFSAPPGVSPAALFVSALLLSHLTPLARCVSLLELHWQPRDFLLPGPLCLSEDFGG